MDALSEHDADADHVSRRHLGRLRKGVIWFYCTVVISSLCALTWSLYISRVEAVKAAEDQLASLSLTLDENVSRTLDASRQAARTITQRPQFMAALAQRDEARLHQDLVSSLGMVRHMRSWSVIEPDGNVLVSTFQFPAPKVNPATRPYFSEAQKMDDVWVDPPVRSLIGGDWIIPMARSIRDENGKLLGILMGSYSPEYLKRFYAGVVGEQDVVIMLTKADGKLLMRYPFVDEAMGMHIGQPWVRDGDSGLTKQVVVEKDPVDHVTRHYVGRKVSNGSLQVLIGMAEPVMLQRWWQDAVIKMVYVSLILLLTGVMSVFLLRQINQLSQSEQDRRRLLAYAQAAQREAVTASQDKAKFLGMLSHELLTPLQTMLSTLGLIENRGSVEVSDPTFIRLKESSRILRSRMSDLVDFAKLSVGQLELRVRAFTPLRMLTMLADDYAEALQEKSLDLHWEPTPELSQRVFSDPTRIRQILENILTNAIKYTERGGITLHAELKNDVFRVEFTDSGMGIAPDQLAHVFDPFYRVKDSAHMAVGSGLGLAVVKSLIDMLHGRIELQSELGQGVRFLVEIPVSSHMTDELPKLPRQRSQQPILVVDDDAGIRHSIADVVRSHGYDAVEVSNGRTALQEAQARPFLAIFCDVQLPDMSGIDVAEKIRKGTGPNVASYLIRMSAFHEPDVRTAELFDACIDKPLDSHQVAEALGAADKPITPAVDGGAQQDAAA